MSMKNAKKVKIIEVRGWDCCRYTESIWINPCWDTDSKVNISNADNDRNPDALHKELRRQGFKKINAQVLTFGVNF